MPPAFCASAMIWRVMVVLPEDSGPKISMTRPRGTPPTPRAASKLIEPVEMTEIGTIASLAPRRMMEPLPNCFSIWLRALSTARARSSARAMGVSPLVDSEHSRTRKDGLKETENANRYRRDCSRKDVPLDRRKSEYLCLRPSLALPVMNSSCIGRTALNHTSASTQASPEAHDARTFTNCTIDMRLIVSYI